MLAISVAACGRQSAHAPLPAPAAPPMIARADLFGEPVRQSAQLSPRGDRVAFIAPRDGTNNLWVLSVDALDQAQPVTDDQGSGIRTYWWAQDNATLLYLQDNAGDENFRLYAAPVAGGDVRALTPEGTRADVLGLSASDPNGVIVTLNQRDPAWPDVYRIDITTGARTLIQRNGNTATVRGFSSFVVDRANHLRLGLKTLQDGGQQVFSRSAEGRWSSLFTIPFADTISSRPLAFESSGQSFLMLDSTDKDRASLVRVDAATGVKAVVGESARADVVDVWLNPGTNAPEAYAANYLRRDWRALDPDAQADLDYLDAQLAGDFTVVSRSNDDGRWIVVEDSPTTPTRSYLYDRTDRAHRRLTLLFRQRPALEQAPLQRTTPIEIQARDGLTLVSYLTLPIGSDSNDDGRPDHPAPLVITPHADAWGRAAFGFDPFAQWLANRGYAVLSVNARGSTGFGKAFLNAGNREWGGRMQEDLLDALQWAVTNGVAQRDHVAIVGAGYGGFAALTGLASTPDQFRCGVSFGGPANLASMLESLPAYWTASRDQLYLRIGDPRTPEGRQALRDHSPLTRAGQITRPLLLALGARDPHTPRADIDQVAGALRGRQAGFVYLVYPEEGHELLRPQNRLSFYAVMEQFLGSCLGGRIEPVGAAFDGANLQAFDGAASVPGLSAFARRTPAAAPASDQTPSAPTEGAGGPDTEATPPADATPAPAATIVAPTSSSLTPTP